MSHSRPPRPSDLRKAPRYAMDAPVEFAGGSGVTRDLSTTVRVPPPFPPN